jgi:hypothetical protein
MACARRACRRGRRRRIERSDHSPSEWRLSQKLGRSGLFRARNGMAVLARTPVLPEATLIGALSALCDDHCIRSATGRSRPEARVPELDSVRAKSARKLPLALRPGSVELPGLISATRQYIRIAASRGRSCGIQGFVVRLGRMSCDSDLVTNDGHRLMRRRSRNR